MTSFKIYLNSNIDTLMKLYPNLIMTYVQKYYAHFFLEVCLIYIYISCCQKEAFYEDKCDQIKELQNGKDNLVIRVIAK